MNTILLEVNGKQYSNFESLDIMLQLDAIAGQFNFIAVSTEDAPLPFKLDDSCSIFINSEKVLTGFIENISVDYDSQSHFISISGRSKTSDIIDSMINALEITAPISLKAIIEKVISHIGADISVVDAVGNVELFNSAEDLISPEVGENAFGFIEKLARKRQVLLTGNGDGNIVIVNPGTDTAPVGLQNVIGGNQNNIETGSVSYDSTNRFGKYITKSQLNMTALNLSGNTDNKKIVDQKSSPVIDEGIRQSRQLVLQAESASSDEQNQKRAEWEANIRKTRSQVYSTTHPDFGFNDKLWAPNQLTPINDDFAGINAQMLLNTVRFSQNTESGSHVVLAFVDKNSYTLLLNEPEKGNVKGEGLIPQFG